MIDSARMDLVTLSGQLAGRAFSALELVEACHRRIERLDRTLNAFRHVDIERARDQAKVSDARKHRLGPLDGIPIAVKENIDVDGWVTRSGLGPRDERSVRQDAAVIRKMRAQGAIVLGHTSMHEGALGATNDNPHHGRTHNPWRLGHTPGGSSGGSASAVAAGLCPLALGTDTMGSIRLPAAYCGLAGYKPSQGLIDNAGIEPLCKALDQVGPLARSVADLRLLFMTPTTQQSESNEIDLRTLRIARLTNVEKVHLDAEVGEAFEEVLNGLGRAGVDVLTVTMDGPDPGKARRAGLLLAESEAAEHFRSDRELYPSAFSDEFAGLLDYGADVDRDRLEGARMIVEQARCGMDVLFEDIDLLLMPTVPQVAFSFDEPAPSNQADLTALANFADVPAVNLPMTCDHGGLPIGLQAIGPRGNDSAVLAAAAALENMLDFRLPELPQGEPI